MKAEIELSLAADVAIGLREYAFFTNQGNFLVMDQVKLTKSTDKSENNYKDECNYTLKNQCKNNSKHEYKHIFEDEDKIYLRDKCKYIYKEQRKLES